jgi:hypothetical protein
MLALPLAMGLAGCSSDIRDAGWFAKPIEFTSRPSWLFYSDGRAPERSKPVGPEEMVSADGGCAAAEAPPAAASAEAQPGSPGGEAGLTAPPPAVGPSGIGLDMTECEVVRRAGRTGAVQIGTNARGDRTVVMTYTSGPSPGIYRFTSGRLTSIERVAEPEPPPKSRKPARTSQTRARS